ncbi:tRNA1(Val) (adenine(37)-N6)-methyltransferase [Arcicella lustrica]|uniref:tRNA1(Val) (adenine(37)-N6)-methyltransferase n=1 Tax=Arcicella lustrica TaxID=2984196 RepID=A0ABU5SCE2_9BACT|nr:methyltransferase [Arcicella sp. DC25W]MEA5424945.1 methyltransferase [Arcicella sp. DC25W]
MSKSINGFQFKQFLVRQDQTAMKVTTDACILGAYTALENATKVLDIGTGTGLIAMMLAQRSKANFSAVELDNNAYQQAVENVQNSIFKEQIRVFHQSIQDFAENNKDLYFELIVSNPPFFQNHLKSEQEKRNKALHTDTLSFEDLLASVIKLLSADGRFVVLLPAYESKVLENLALQEGLYPHKKLLIRHRNGSKILRIITTFGLTEKETIQEELIIRNLDESYTAQFSTLLKEYYLIF